MVWHNERNRYAAVSILSNPARFGVFYVDQATETKASSPDHHHADAVTSEYTVRTIGEALPDLM